MASIAEQLKLIEKQIQLKIQDAMQKEVATEVIKVAQNKVDEVVYKQYKPKSYRRTGELRKDFVSNPTANGIVITNTRSEGGNNISEIIESGEGYHYSSDKGYNTFDKEGRTYETPRPFFENTRNELRKNKQHVQALKLGLIKRGITVV